MPNTLDEFFPDLTATDDYGLISPSRRADGYLSVPVALEDKPKEQKREVLSLDLSGAGGHVAVAGGPLTGKSTFLRTMVASLAPDPQPPRGAVLRAGLRRRHLRGDGGGWSTWPAWRCAATMSASTACSRR